MKLLNFVSPALIATMMVVNTAALAQQNADREHYVLQTYTLKPANVSALDEHLSKTYLPAAKRAGAGPIGVFRQVEARDAAILHVLTVLKSAAEASGLEAKIKGDASFKDTATGSYDSLETSVFVAIQGMPKMEKPDTNKPRLLNLRIYESPNPAAHEKKVEMFNIGELAIFKKVGLTPVMFGSAISGPRMPNLTYLLVFPDDEARKASWKTFGGDPEWQALKAKPGYSDKEIITKITNIILTPAPYSEI